MHLPQAYEKHFFIYWVTSIDNAEVNVLSENKKILHASKSMEG